MKFDYFVGKEIGKHGGERFEVNAGRQLINMFAMYRSLLMEFRACEDLRRRKK